jgi:hypothetical protein
MATPANAEIYKVNVSQFSITHFDGLGNPFFVKTSPFGEPGVTPGVVLGLGDPNQPEELDLVNGVQPFIPGPVGNPIHSFVDPDDPPPPDQGTSTARGAMGWYVAPDGLSFNIVSSSPTFITQFNPIKDGNDSVVLGASLRFDFDVSFWTDVDTTYDVLSSYNVAGLVVGPGDNVYFDSNITWSGGNADSVNIRLGGPDPYDPTNGVVIPLGSRTGGYFSTFYGNDMFIESGRSVNYLETDEFGEVQANVEFKMAGYIELRALDPDGEARIDLRDFQFEDIFNIPEPSACFLSMFAFGTLAIVRRRRR